MIRAIAQVLASTFPVWVTQVAVLFLAIGVILALRMTGRWLQRKGADIERKHD